MQDRNGNGPESTVPAATDHEPGLGRFHQAGWVCLTSSVQCLLDNSLLVVPEGLEKEGSKAVFTHVPALSQETSHPPSHHPPTPMEQAISYILKKGPSLVAQRLLGHEREPVLLLVML